jgi:hypothetical protein
MKKFFFILFATTFMVNAFSQQQIPNGGFEDWSGSPLRPTGWDTWETLSNGALSGFAQKDSTTGNFVEGKASIKLTSDSAMLQNQKRLLSGYAEYFGTFSAKPDTLKFFYKYAPVGDDSALIGINIYRFDNTTSSYINFIGGFVYLSGTNNLWYSIFVPLEYDPNATGTPDSIAFTLFSSKGLINRGAKGSQVRFDNIRFTYKTAVGIQEAAFTYTGVKFYPNPASTRITFDGEVNLAGHECKIFSLDGKLVLSTIMDSNTADVSALHNGLYLFEVNKDGMNMLKGKFNISR